MLETLLEILKDGILDTLKLFPFLLITFLVMEYIEHKMTNKSKKIIEKSGKLGPLFGGFVGIIPQCGFSASATNLYVAKVITIGTLISVYLSTSDEMLPILISESMPLNIIFTILGIKLLIGIFSGFLIDFFFRKFHSNLAEEQKIEDLCEHEHCDCKHNGVFKSAIKHTLNITLYIFILSLVIGTIVEFIGEENIATFIGNHLILGPVISSLIGLIPNCAASVIITNLYVQGIINSASLIAGLLTGAGVGLIILFKLNKNIKENIIIVSLIYGIGAISGIVLQALHFNI